MVFVARIENREKEKESLSQHRKRWRQLRWQAEKKRRFGTVSEQIASQLAVRQHVTVTTAFQLIKNKRCQRTTDENPSRRTATNVIYRQVCRRVDELPAAPLVGFCCLNDCPSIIHTRITRPVETRCSFHSLFAFPSPRFFDPGSRKTPVKVAPFHAAVPER